MLIKSENLLKEIDFAEEVFKDYLCLDVGLIYKTDPLEHLAYSINYYRNAHNKSKILFCDYYEAPNSSFLKLMNEIVKILVTRYNYNKQDLVYMAGCLPTIENKTKLDKLFYEENLIDLEKILYPFFEIEWSNLIKNANSKFQNNFKKLHDRNLRQFNNLYFIGRWRFYRLYLFSKLIEKNFIEKCVYSQWGSFEFIQESLDRHNERYPDDCLLKQKETIKKYVTSFNNGTPNVLSIEPFNHKEQHELHLQDIDIFAKTYYSIIPETSFFKFDDYKVNDQHNHWNFHLDYTFLTEKTFRSIAYLHPFIMASRPYTLQHLRQLGYKTFHPFIDESYDEIEDDDLRLDSILKSIEKLHNKTNEEWMQFQHDIYPIVCHNYEVLGNALKYTDKYVNARDYYHIRGQKQS